MEKYRKYLLDKDSDHVRKSFNSFINISEIIKKENLEGDIVECGVYAGGYMILASKLFPKKNIWLFDSFEGNDHPSGGKYTLKYHFKNKRKLIEDPWNGKEGFLSYPIEKVKKNFKDERIELNSRIKFVKGYFSKTLYDDNIKLPTKIAILRIDSDGYSSYLEVLYALYDKVVNNGFIIFDDYAFPSIYGAALPKFFENKKKPIIWNTNGELASPLETKKDVEWKEFGSYMRKNNYTYKPKMINYINTNTFRDIADHIIMLNDNKPFTTDILRKNSIIYCKRDYIDHLFQNLQFSGRKYILITHASDKSVTSKEFNKKPNCIKRWYAENAKYDHPDLIPIPIGLSPNKGIDETPLDLDWFIDSIARFKNTSKNEKVLYCNWTMVNNQKIRGPILEKFKNNGIKYTWNYPVFTEEEKRLTQEKSNVLKEGKSTKQEISKLLHYYDYCEEMAKYKFVVAPEGNGDGDTHRTWEALYMGAFPIVLKSNIFKGMEDLPLIQVNDYSEVTYDLLNSYLDKEYDYEKLFMKYWENRILNDLKTV